MSLKHVLLGLLAALLCVPAAAVKRCVDAKGKVTYQDALCASASESAAVDTSEAFSKTPRAPSAQAGVQRGSPSTAAGPTPADPAYATYVGAWRGPAQFELSTQGVREGAAHVVAPMVIELRANGEVVGVIPEAGCKLSGLATQFVAAYMSSVDVSLSACRDDRFNTRYSGHLNTSAAAKEARLNLVALTTRTSFPAGVRFQQVSLDAVLKR